MRKQRFTFSHFSLFSWILPFFTLSFSFSGAETSRRKLSFELNPGLNASISPLPPGVDLLHVRALGDNDTLHFLLCSLRAPALLLIHTNTSSSLQVDWPKFLSSNNSGSLKVEPESSVLFSSSLTFSRLWEFDDRNDTAVTECLFPPFHLQNFTWSGVNLKGASASLCGADRSPSFSNGSLCLQFSAFDSEGRDNNWPRLLHNANSAQLRVWLHGLLPRTAYSRFQLELQVVGGAYPLSRVDVLRSIDDEFMPSIFKVSQWVSSVNRSSEVSGFVQWKPVAFRRSDPALEDATPCRHLTPQLLSPAPETSGLIRAFYGSEPETFGLNVTFGIAGEPFYNATQFLSWTLLMGVGSPPLDSFSPLVLSIMAVGLGTPLLLFLLGGIGVCFHRLRPTLPYEPIN
ncbi:hypothetical protein LDENG_00206410 [Lucifuga dentata]|nr:hypothetical protein LDENG_00206410 [Lucifuga dentata]